ncbi:MAG: 2-C-methyl-D-erythritol 2,4-cyclodiphosphate synthase [Gemmatimonadetes bacterium]|nr:MAG: 2-C-methyl-D-erythritol 2,4-cyclodiphosphate synthase [Gemmatimonadota bacterium]
MRVGFGYDSHRFDEGRPLILAGVTIPDAPGLAGHSDGDAVAHAVIDALLGAAAAGDVGRMFPPDDERWKDADSMELLERAMRRLVDLNFRVVNVDVTVICERPKILPYAQDMRKELARRLGVGIGSVSLKGKTNERMGWIGAGEGLAVHAVALIRSIGQGNLQAGWGDGDGLPL